MKATCLMFLILALGIQAQVSDEKNKASSQRQNTTTSPAQLYERIRLWIQALSPFLGAITVLFGLVYAARSHRMETHRHEAEWYEQFRGLYDGFWNSEEMARMRK